MRGDIHFPDWIEVVKLDNGLVQVRWLRGLETYSRIVERDRVGQVVHDILHAGVACTEKTDTRRGGHDYASSK